ncbi:MAG: acetyl-CoA carboxylase biotin carboxyl carrier protein subunit [Marinilabiliales bacterium]|nr:MAG: acetyl-CoA carboxylase biotin carboxyl carrier protein subunit [Marinilabiliales bacterium]
MEENTKKKRLSSIVVEGVKYMTHLTDKYKNRVPYQEDDPCKIKSFIPGTIVDVNIKQGSKIKEGDVLLILEAMKMRNLVTAPCDGKVKKVHVKLQQMVPKNFLMIEIE